MCRPFPAAMTPLLVAVCLAILGSAAAQPFKVNGTFAPRFVVAPAESSRHLRHLAPQTQHDKIERVHQTQRPRVASLLPRSYSNYIEV